MNETRATTPAFPPGRYGRRRDGRRHLTVPLTVLAIIVIGSLLLTVRLYRQYGETDYQAQIVGWTDVTTTSMTIEFTVRVPAGASAACTLRARDYNGNEVGRQDVVVTAAASSTGIDAAEKIKTTARGSVGDIIRCRPAD